MMNEVNVQINQSVAVLIDGNNIERSIHSMLGTENAMLNFDILIPRILGNRGLNRLIYFREGIGISTKLAERLHQHYHGSVVPCHKSADIPLSIKATQVASKVDTIIILSGDSDFVELVRHLKGEGVRVEVAAVEMTTAKILKEEVDYFFPILKDDCFILSGGAPKSGPKRNNSKSKPKTPRSNAKNSSGPKSGSSTKSESGNASKARAEQNTSKRKNSGTSKASTSRSSSKKETGSEEPEKSSRRSSTKREGTSSASKSAPTRKKTAVKESPAAKKEKTSPPPSKTGLSILKTLKKMVSK